MTSVAAVKLCFIFLIGTIVAQPDGCNNISGFFRPKDRLMLHGVNDESLKYLPSCLENTSRVYILSVRESNFTLSGLVNALSDRVRKFIVDLEINNCDITEIPTGVLSNLPRLRYINLRGNTISVLDVQSFSNMTSLQSINLSNNRLKTILPNTFINLPELNEISLQNNKLNNISRNAFRNVPSLIVIYFDHNRLKEIPYFAFTPPRIKFMHATNNRIREISSNIKRLKELVNLDIRNNSLDSVQRGVLYLHNLQELHISWNNLTTLPVELSPLIENVSFNIALGNNPWHCGCNLKWLISWVKMGNTKEEIFCETPQYVNMSLFDVGGLDCTELVNTALHRSGYIVLTVVLILVVITTCATFFYLCIWNKKGKSMKRPIRMIVNGQYYIPQSDNDSSDVTTITLSQSQYMSTDCQSPNKKNVKKIQFHEKNITGLLRLGKRIGRGAFGDVFEGLTAESNSSLWKRVAIKRIRDNAASYDSDNLITEYRHLTDIGKHPNIIQVFGIGKLDGSLIMVMELAENGDLLGHLKEIEKSNHRTIRNMDSSEEKFYFMNRHPRLFVYMWHIAKGMEYLSNMKVVHRDLAARNILLAAGNIAKLSDFGLSRDVYENGYYYQNSKGRLPYKWMGPETLSNGKFTSRSDVWSYGVLLWEIVTLGSSPYPGIPPDMLINMYKSKYIMPQPPLCPDSIYSVMKDCWKHIPEDRTDFTSLVERLDKLVQTFSKKQYMDISFDQGGQKVSLVNGDVTPD
ncbi:fibroblast growth factor receptor 2-like isoform X1 [Ruditapes philippinarum]|uniref:fibroblast growth factor receptor 2-like isoform X1 n=1 Tax=Ruditapes philippinarum TaxID=129788 RepID=UPI00295B7DD9|nr:fibroblast growth factor receptor 2-like isoform X1 [Ruditapes philippinarum]